MAVPILKQGPFLIASIQSALTDTDFVQLRDALVGQVGSYRSRGVIVDVTALDVLDSFASRRVREAKESSTSRVIVDVTALDVLDSFASRTLRDLAHMVRLRGAETVIVGIQPEVAFTMVRLGLTLEGVATALDLEEGLFYLDQKLRSTQQEG